MAGIERGASCTAPAVDSPHWHDHGASSLLETRMPPVVHTTFFLLLVMQSASLLAAPSAKPIRVSYTEPDRTYGLVFTPPAGKHWKAEKWGSGNVRVDWNAGSTTNTRTIEAYMTRPDGPVTPISGYIDNVRRRIEGDFSNSPLVSINSLQISEYPADSRCVRIHLRLQLKEPAADGQQQWTEQYTLSCGSLQYADVGYELRYFHRYVDANRDPQLEAQANAVLASMVIEEPAQPR
jgi:hypothetical protein